MVAQTLVPAAQLAAEGRTPFPGESAAYRDARRALLAQEIEFRRHMTRVTEQRRALPDGPVIERDYRFKDADGAEVGLADLFGDKDTLVSYFWMYGPQRERPCPMCTNWLGAVAGNADDIKQRVALKIFGRSPVERQMTFAQERGWRGLEFVQRRLCPRPRTAERGREREPGAGGVQARGRPGAAVLGQRDDPGDGRSGAGPARRARRGGAVVDPRPDA
nr:DUF899 family protein [Phenylobacterium sp.]